MYALFTCFDQCECDAARQLLLDLLLAAEGQAHFAEKRCDNFLYLSEALREDLEVRRTCLRLFSHNIVICDLDFRNDLFI